MNECDHGSDPRSCPVCQGPKAKPPTPTVLARFVARYDGTCPLCQSAIWAGHRVAKMSNDTTVHELCAVAP